MSKAIINRWRRWLAKQRHREDPVGDFARDFLDDPDCKGLNTLSSIDHYLMSLGVKDKVLDARDRAWREYAGHDGESPPVRVGSRFRLSLGGEHQEQLLYVRGVVDGRLVIREWAGGRWNYSILSPSWWSVNSEYVTVEGA